MIRCRFKIFTVAALAHDDSVARHGLTLCIVADAEQQLPQKDTRPVLPHRHIEAIGSILRGKVALDPALDTKDALGLTRPKSTGRAHTQEGVDARIPRSPHVAWVIQTLVLKAGGAVVDAPRKDATGEAWAIRGVCFAANGEDGRVQRLLRLLSGQPAVGRAREEVSK